MHFSVGPHRVRMKQWSRDIKEQQASDVRDEWCMTLEPVRLEASSRLEPVEISERRRWRR